MVEQNPAKRACQWMSRQRRRRLIAVSSAGIELELLLKLPYGTTRALEVKRTTTPKVTRGYHQAAEDINADQKILVYADDQYIHAKDGLRAIPDQFWALFFFLSMSDCASSMTT